MQSGEQVSRSEIQKFDDLAGSWWQEDGEMRLLHAMHPARMRFIRQHLEAVYLNGFSGLQAVDVGCGGGLTAESLCRIGLKVSGVDASARLINAARLHAEEAGLVIDYSHAEFCDYALQHPESADILCALEVIEHVSNPEEFLQSCSRVLRTGGVLFLSSINRTWKSCLLGIGLAEYALRLLPVGTHDWHRFQKPSEIAAMLPECRVLGLAGMLPSPDLHQWRLSPRRVQVNYVMALKKGN